MSRSPVAFASADMSALARRLREQLVALGELPSHLQLLNMLAKAAGYRNFQHLRSAADSASAAAARPPEIDRQRVARVAGHFGAEGQLLRWPSRTNHQELCIWVLWSRLPPRDVMDERGISAWLNAQHDFGDAALLRRTLVTMGLVARTRDGREYRRIERKPPADLVELLQTMADREAR